MGRLIPWEQVEPLTALWADPDEKIESIRNRLRDLGGHSQYNAPLLIRLSDGRIAPTAVPMLRKLAQTQGAPILQRQASELLEELCPEPWAVAGQEPDHADAAAAADLRCLPVLVTEDDEPIGLMLPASHRSVPLDFSKELFDLFDEPLSPAVFEPAEFVTASLDTNLAQIALDLKALENPKRAHVIVRMDDGSFGVVTTSALNREVEGQAGAWTRPLRSLQHLLRAAESREYRLLGRKQAQEIAKHKGHLVLTKQGDPVGILLSDVVRRSGDGLEAMVMSGPRAAAHDLYSAPEPMLTDLAAAGPELSPRYVNLWFENSGQRPLARSRALVQASSYFLALNLGSLQQSRSIVDWASTPGGPQAIVEPQEAEAKLYASVFSADFEVERPTQVLTLPTEGDSETLRFPVLPLRSTYDPRNPATLDVCLYYRCNLVQSFHVQVEVLAQEGEARSKTPQRAELKAARIDRYPNLDQVQPRELSLTITKQAEGVYQFTYTLEPEKVQEPRWEAIRLGYRVHLRREDLTHLITKARRQLYNISRHKDYQTNLTPDKAVQRKAMQALALLGRQLYSHLFEVHDPKSSAGTVAQWIEEHLPEGSTIQIIDRARDFVFPWSLIYDGVPWDEGGLAQKVDVTRFWGWQYRIELLTEELLETYRVEGVEIKTPAGLQVGIGMNDEIAWAEEQRGFFGDLIAECGESANYQVYDSSPDLTAFLQDGNLHLFYVFCHGFTERMATDIQIGDDLLGEFKAWLRTLSPEERKALKPQQEDELFNVGDSWIKLRYGTVPLTMMEYYAAPRLAYAPLVFLNMCESAQVLPSLSGGFIPFFIKRGARGVIGTECPMTSTFANPFSQAFFRRFLQGQSVGQIVWELRREYMEQGNPLGLAYTLYCDAGTRLTEAILESENNEKESEMTDQALEQQVSKMWLKGEEDLYATLGITEDAIAKAKVEDNADALEKAQTYDAGFSVQDTNFSQIETDMGAADFFKELGQKWWAELEPKLYDILCNKSNPEHGKLMDALEDGAKVLAVALVPALVAQVAALPAAAIVIATIAAKKVADAGLVAACKMWKESIDKEETPEAAG